ncbi:ABC transporter ATP-binding protein [Spirulina subsalsa FACHB-351]|uniref:ABC transporter ATP-binding protein n=1 Tax=Spirulina subsalsa FACHB-351 TaxID=234711 RepID=A0ABT3L5X2_9CYAN|nr:ABC transporter ATP-binding protein [Spirulina subsalsa]MCW6036893.1 ABC transporter ATP-binding protein [Spirulina subsalsa FACHB-351]
MIEVEHLSKHYGSTSAIEDIVFSVAPGEILGFLGPNGAGKTTTMRILSGYLPATTGTARIAGFDVHEESMEVRRRIGYLPETPPLYEGMTVEGFLDFVARIKGVSAGDRTTRIDWAIQRCNLEEKRKVLIRKLSKGFRQRIGIAQALVHNPPVIILDEPTVGLDPRQINEVRHLIKSLAGDHTIILSSHILPEVSMTCDRVTIINRGKVVATNTPDRLLAQLGEGEGYELEVQGDATLVQSLLQVIPGVQSVTVTYPMTSKSELGETVKNLDSRADTLRDRSLIKITCIPNTEPGRHLAKVIVETGLGLCEMRRSRPTLEDVFLELTTQEDSFSHDSVSQSEDREFITSETQFNQTEEE